VDKLSKVLVTGGCGFIGSAMVKLLLKKNFEVRAFDISFQIDDNPPPEDAEIYKGSILDINDLTNAMDGCDYVVHLAAALGVNRTEKERLSTLAINIQGTVNVLEACVKDNIKKIVFSSSSEVYGQQSKLPIKENNPLNPKSIYAITKLAGEEYLKAFHQRYGLNYSIVRFFNVYGPLQVAEFVMPRFINAVMHNKPPIIYGKGDQTRAFCYVDDAVKGTFLTLQNSNANSEIFNIGNDTELISMNDLALKIIEISQKRLMPEYIPINESDRTEEREINSRFPDISKAKKVMDYKPSISLSKGISKVIKFGRIEKSWTVPTVR
jgi:UDP-glucose 4-epimerase